MLPAYLDLRLHILREKSGLPDELCESFKDFLLSAPDEALFRMSPLRFAASQKISEQQAIDLFLHATHAGILEFVWGILCPGCLAFLTTPGALRSIGRRHCSFCIIDIDRSFDDRVEVAFTVSPCVRKIRFHSPDTLDLRADALRLYFSSSVAPESHPHRLFEAGILIADRIPASGAATICLPLTEGDTVLMMPAHHAALVLETREGQRGPRSVSVELFDGWTIPDIVEVAPGPIDIHVTNRMLQPVGYIVAPTQSGIWPGPAPPGQPLTHPFLPYLTGPRLITSQTFRELFRTESLPAQEGLEIKGVTLVFTDLKGSTALYERIGDLQAYALVRKHFDVLRLLIAQAGGSIVKTIGDAVMASFAEPMAAIQAVTRMNEELKRQAGDALHLKIGVHTGTCIAVELNDYLDYFGRTVNIAARVQGLAGPGEIVCTDAVYQTQGVPEFLANSGFRAVRSTVSLRGIAEDTAVIRCS